MSLVKVSGNASGTGTLTIAAPNTNSDFTLTLPTATTTFVGTDATQTLTNKTLTSPTFTTPNINSAQIATVSGTAPLYMCRAWCLYNATPSILGSANVTSLTVVGTGDVKVNFTTNMPDANYSAVFTTNEEAGTAKIANATQYAVDNVRLVTYNLAGTKVAYGYNSVAVFR